MAESAEGIEVTSTDRVRIGLRWGGAVLALFGIWQLTQATVSQDPGLVGRLFFPAERVDALVRDAAPLAVPYVELCQETAVRESFDSLSVRRLERWCKAVHRFADAPGPIPAAGLMRAGNLHFERIIEKLMAAGGDTARRGVVLFEARCALRPLLEKVNSQLAGAAFSQGLLGVLFAALGGYLLFRRKVVSRGAIA